MNEAGMIAGSLIGGGPVLWSDLREEVRHHLEQQGLQPLQAERCSHEIVVRCAVEHAEDGAASLRERAMAEAETMLIGLRTGAKGELLDAA